MARVPKQIKLKHQKVVQTPFGKMENHSYTPEQPTYELWFLGDVYESGVKTRETFNRFLVEAGSLLRIATEENIVVGGLEIVEVSPEGKIVDSVWSMNVDDYKANQ